MLPHVCFLLSTRFIYFPYDKAPTLFEHDLTSTTARSQLKTIVEACEGIVSKWPSGLYAIFPNCDVRITRPSLTTNTTPPRGSRLWIGVRHVVCTHHPGITPKSISASAVAAESVVAAAGYQSRGIIFCKCEICRPRSHFPLYHRLSRQFYSTCSTRRSTPT